MALQSKTYIDHAKRLRLPIGIIQGLSHLFDLLRGLLISEKRIFNLENTKDIPKKYKTCILQCCIINREEYCTSLSKFQGIGKSPQSTVL